MEIILKKKQDKLDTLIAALDPHSDKYSSYEGIMGAAAMTLIHSPTVEPGTWPAKVNGLAVIQHKKFPPVFHTVLGEYMSRIRGNTNVGFVLPGVKVTNNFADIYRYADDNRMERTYGYYVLNKAGEPIMFVFTGNIAEFMFHAIPHTVVFGTKEWANAVHAWAKRGLMKHRYFDATNMGIASEVEPWVPEVPAPLTTPEGEAVVAPAPAPKKKAGRPRKKK